MHSRTFYAVIAVVAIAAIAVAAISISYLYLPPSEMRFVEQRVEFGDALWGIRLHVAGGIVALLLGPVQFLPFIRRRFVAAHRWIGRAYLVAVAAGSIGAFVLAPTAFGGLPSTVGFILLATLWLGSAAIAYCRIRERDIAGHRAWMLRTYALTFAAVTIRIELVALHSVAGFDFEAAYTTLCWVPNLILMELWLAYRGGRSVAA